jgi:hypothetical protein
MVDGLQGVGIPEADRLVCRAASTGQESMLMGGPGDCLHCSDMTRKLGLIGGAVVYAPKQEFVIISTRS